jgi:membrane-bound lytic murein transglycosylase D
VASRQTVPSSQTSEQAAAEERRQLEEAEKERRDEAVKTLIAEARSIHERGLEFWAAGEREKAREAFRQSLDRLKAEGETSADPRIDQVYYELLNEVQRLEIVASFKPDEPPFPILEALEPSESPLDEIGAVDLYAVEVDPGLEDLVSEDLRNTRFDFPVVVKKEVLKFLNYYQGRNRKALEASLVRSGRYLPLFREIFKEEGVPQDLIYMAHVESLFKPQAYSRARARGIWQFVKGTARLYGLKVGWWLDERLDYRKSARSAARYLKDLHEQFGSWYLALAAYNGGPGRVARVIRRYGEMDYWTMAKRRLLLRETRNYVPSILAAIIISRNPQRYGFMVEPEPSLEFETVSLDYQVDLAVIAESIEVPLATMMLLNPELQRGVTPFESKGYLLKVPPGKRELLTQQLAKIPPEKRLRLKHHRVRQGETLSHISARYGVSISGIAEVNRIRNIHRLRLGQDLIIPLTDRKGLVSTESRKKALKTGKHTVRQGDSLYRIARLYGVNLNDLFRWNNIRPGEHIHPGQQISISSGTGSSIQTTASGENE